ncbi:MAG: nucleotide-binding protein [Proteobacteria bacterium]|nr:nucleotide-binding protein [Pseudomonadota bacterium]
MGLGLSAALTLGLGACKKQEGAAPSAGPSALTGTAAQAAGARGAEAGGKAIAGTITETMDAGAYTYLKLATAQGEVWAAVRKTEVSKGQQATVTQAMLMSDFKSPTLKRTFERIYFGALAGEAASHGHGGRMGGGRMGGGMMGSGRMGGEQGPKGGPSADELKVAHGRARNAPKLALKGPLSKAEGPDAFTIAELHAKREALAGKTVRVRGQVSKFNAEIMDRNWLHLQDGSGSSDKADFDLTVTTKDATEVGQVVVVQGILQKDRDFGAGYAYPLIVESATIKTIKK